MTWTTFSARTGTGRVLVLGYVSEFGVTDMIAAALGTISDAGLRAWVVPGNHDVALSTNALSTAAETLTSNVALETDHPRQCEGITVCGHGLRSRDGGQTCQATNLPDPARFHSRLLLSATHYPLLSQHAYLRVAGLRYPGDLLNLDEARAAAERFQGPILVLHGHLHTAVIRHVGRILQIGSPTVVEWPHAWTDASIEFTSDTVRIRTALTPIPGQWSTGGRNSVLAEREQNWAFTTGVGGAQDRRTVMAKTPRAPISAMGRTPRPLAARLSYVPARRSRGQTFRLRANVPTSLARR